MSKIFQLKKPYFFWFSFEFQKLYFVKTRKTQKSRNELVPHCRIEKFCLLHTKKHLKLNFRKKNSLCNQNKLYLKNAFISSAMFGLRGHSNNT